MKKFLCGIIVGATLMSVIPAVAKNVQEKIDVIYRDIKVNVDGELLDTTGTEPFIYQGTTYLPVRKVAEALDKKVDWDGATATVSIGSPKGAAVSIFDVMKPYAANYCTIYSGNDKFEFLGAERKNGVMFDDVSPYLTFNTDGNYKELTFETGMDNYGGVMEIYADDKLVQEVDVPGSDSPKKVTVDLTGVLQIKLIPTGNFYNCGCWNMNIK